VVVVRVVVLRSQNFLSPATRESDPRGSVRNAKFSQVLPRVLVVRTQNFLIQATRVNGTRGSDARVIGMNEKFSKASRAC